jgi:hypothetical protein
MTDSTAGEPVLPESDASRAGDWLSALTLEHALGEWTAIALIAPLLLTVAWWNGFPLIFYDTGAYLLEGLKGVFLMERSPVYSLFLYFTGAARSFWYPAFIQALMTAFVMTMFARAEVPRLPVIRLVALVIALILFTGLAWYVGQLEPDCMTALVVLGLYLLAFRAQRLGPVRSGLLIVVSGLSVACHPSHLGLAAGLAFALGLLRLAAHLVPRLRYELPKPDLTYPVATFALGLGLVLAANDSLTGQMFVSRSGPVFIFARMLQDGIVKRDLDDTCPAAHYVLCKYKDQLPDRGDAWLWQRTSIFNKLHRFAGTAKESERIVIDSLERYPLLQVEMAIKDTVVQFFLVRTGDGIEPQEWVLQKGLHWLVPRQLPDYLHARQQRGDIHVFGFLNVIYCTVALFTLLALIYALRNAWVARDWEGLTLPAFLLVALLGNAFICGALSNPHDRYQARLAWVPTFALALTLRPRAVFSLRRPVESVT